MFETRYPTYCGETTTKEDARYFLYQWYRGSRANLNKKKIRTLLDPAVYHYTMGQLRSSRMANLATGNRDKKSLRKMILSARHLRKHYGETTPIFGSPDLLSGLADPNNGSLSYYSFMSVMESGVLTKLVSFPIHVGILNRPLGDLSFNGPVLVHRDEVLVFNSVDLVKIHLVCDKTTLIENMDELNERFL